MVIIWEFTSRCKSLVTYRLRFTALLSRNLGANAINASPATLEDPARKSAVHIGQRHWP